MKVLVCLFISFNSIAGVVRVFDKTSSTAIYNKFDVEEVIEYHSTGDPFRRDPKVIKSYKKIEGVRCDKTSTLHRMIAANGDFRFLWSSSVICKMDIHISKEDEENFFEAISIQSTLFPKDKFLLEVKKIGNLIIEKKKYYKYGNNSIEYFLEENSEIDDEKSKGIFNAFALPVKETVIYEIKEIPGIDCSKQIKEAGSLELLKYPKYSCWVKTKKKYEFGKE